MRKGRNRDEDWKFKSKHDAALAGLAVPHARSGWQRRAEARQAAALLSEVTVLRAVPAEVLAELAGSVWEMQYPAGRVLASQGSRTDNGIIVLRGSVVEHVSGVQVAVHAEQSLLNLALTPGVHIASSTMVAGPDLRALVVELSGLVAAVERHPEIAAALASPAAPEPIAAPAPRHEPHPDHHASRIHGVLGHPGAGLVAGTD